MKKQITVVYSTTVTIDIPDEITDEMIFDADQKRFGVCPEVENLLTEILQDASSQIGWRDGEITDIHEEMPDEMPDFAK